MKRKNYAGCHFLKWFTVVDNNIRFSVSSGYLPVKKEAGAKERLETVLAEAGEEDAASDNLLIGLRLPTNMSCIQRSLSKAETAPARC